MSSPPSPHAAHEIDNLRGALWMLGSSLAFAVTGVVMKYMTAHLPAIQVSFGRAVTGVLVLAPIIMRHGWVVYRTSVVSRHLARIMFSTVAATTGIYAIAKLPLALATSLGFTRPLFMIIIAAVFLGEIVGWRRGLATAFGFAGVVITVGPSHMDVSWGFAGALTSAASLAAAMAVVKSLSRIDGPATIMCWSTTGVCVMTAIPAFFVWIEPTSLEWLLMGSTGITASIGQYMMIRAFTHGEATVVNPIDYVQIVFVSIGAYFLFAEVPTLWTLLGTAIIVGSTMYIVLRDARLKKPVSPTDA